MKRKIVLIVSLLVLVLVSTPLMVACAESPAPGPETPPITFEPIVWRFNANYAQEGTYGKMYRVFADNLEQRSGGRPFHKPNDRTHNLCLHKPCGARILFQT